MSSSDRPKIPMNGTGASDDGSRFGVTHNQPSANHVPALNNHKRPTRIPRYRARTAIWFPVLLVTVLLLIGLMTGNNNRQSEQNEPTTNSSVPAESGSEIAPVVQDGALSEVIRTSIVQVISFEDGQPCATGSGSVISDGLTVLTNFHVVSDSESCKPDLIKVLTNSDTTTDPLHTYNAQIAIQDESLDVAILQLIPIVNNPPTLIPLQLAFPSPVGSEIIVIGFPAVGGTSVTVSKGVISGVTVLDGVQWIKTDAAISGGNSGGAALDTENRLIGMPTMFSQASDGTVTDCRQGADTNGDGEISSDDLCVGLGGTFTLMANMTSAADTAARIGISLDIQASSGGQ